MMAEEKRAEEANALPQLEVASGSPLAQPSEAQPSHEASSAPSEDVAMGDAAGPQAMELGGDTPIEAPQSDVIEPAANIIRNNAVLCIGGLGVDVLQQVMLVMMAAQSTLEGNKIYGHLSGELLDNDLAVEGRAKERRQMDEFGVFYRVPRREARGKRVRAQWLDDYKTDADGRTCVISRRVAMQASWDARSDCFV